VTRESSGARLRELFRLACELEGDGRTRFLEKLRNEDPPLADELEELLKQDEERGVIPAELESFRPGDILGLWPGDEEELKKCVLHDASGAGEDAGGGFSADARPGRGLEPDARFERASAHV